MYILVQHPRILVLLALTFVFIVIYYCICFTSCDVCGWRHLLNEYDKMTAWIFTQTQMQIIAEIIRKHLQYPFALVKKPARKNRTSLIHLWITILRKFYEITYFPSPNCQECNHFKHMPRLFAIRGPQFGQDSDVSMLFNTTTVTSKIMQRLL